MDPAFVTRDGTAKDLERCHTRFGHEWIPQSSEANTPRQSSDPGTGAYVACGIVDRLLQPLRSNSKTEAPGEHEPDESSSRWTGVDVAFLVSRSGFLPPSWKYALKALAPAGDQKSYPALPEFERLARELSATCWRLPPARPDQPASTPPLYARVMNMGTDLSLTRYLPFHAVNIPPHLKMCML